MYAEPEECATAIMRNQFSDEQPPGDGRERWFTEASLPYIPPSRLSEYDMRYDQGLDQLVYLQALINEEIEG